MMCIMFFWLTFCFDCDQGYDEEYTLQFQEHWLTHLLSLKVTRRGRPWLSKLNVWGGRSFGLGCQTFFVSLSHSVMCQSKSRKNINLNKVKAPTSKVDFLPEDPIGQFWKWYCFMLLSIWIVLKDPPDIEVPSHIGGHPKPHLYHNIQEAKTNGPIRYIFSNQTWLDNSPDVKKN